MMINEVRQSSEMMDDAPAEMGRQGAIYEEMERKEKNNNSGNCGYSGWIAAAGACRIGSLRRQIQGA